MIAVIASLAVFAAAGTVAAATAGPAPGLPTGKFRTVISDADLRRGKANPDYIHENHGTYTLTLSPGRFKYVHPDSFEARVVTGIVRIKGNVATFVVKTPFSFQGIDWLVKWRLQGGRLHFTVLAADFPELRVVFGAHPWRKI